MRNFYIEIKVPGRKRPVTVSGSEMEIEIRQRSRPSGAGDSISDLAGQFTGAIEEGELITIGRPPRLAKRLHLRGVVFGIGGSRQFHKITEV